MRKLYELYSSGQYKNLTSTTRDVFYLLYGRYKASEKNTNKGSNEWIDDLGVFCYFSQKELAKILGKTERTIRRAFKLLKDMKLIHVLERGSQKLAKIYVNVVWENKNQCEVKLESEEVGAAFQQTFGEKPNIKEVKSLNELTKKYDINDLVEAIGKSHAVRFKKARISYINKTLVSLQENAEERHIGAKFGLKRVRRYELVPDWLKKQLEPEPKPELKRVELTQEDLEKIEYMKKLQQQYLGA